MDRNDSSTRREDTPTISASVERKLVDTLFVQQSSLVIGAVASVGISLFCYVHEGRMWLLSWPVICVLVTAGRLLLALAYKRRDTSDCPELWANRFAIGAAMNALVWGIPSALVMMQPDSFVQTVVISGQVAYVSAAAVRNNAVPRTVLVQSFLSLGLLFAACLAKREPYHLAYGFFVLLFMAGALEIARFLRRRTCDLLIAEERAAKVLDELAQANALLETMAMTDGLTGLGNRRGFDVGLSNECARAARDGTDLSLVMLDIDHFKALNDAFGHQAGDACLRHLATCLIETVRSGVDIVARYGGEEFAILLPQAHDREAARVAERLRRAVQNLALPHPGQSGVTVSVGHATSRHGRQFDVTALITRADAALYRAKAEGRNRVVGSPITENEPQSDEAMAA